jgi:predicted  nucleic acid-binding Zn-ribbon protein
MNADIQRLIDLQRLDSAAHDAERRVAEEPTRLQALDARLETARQHLATAKAKLTASQTARREIEKDVAVHQGRLSKFRDQLMSVKTNIEYQAMQKEITVQKTVDADRRALAAEIAEMKQIIERVAAERRGVMNALDPKVLATFEQVASRKHGVAVAEARDGICTICHVRLRPQVFNTVRRNEEIIQCDSCQRILYFASAPTAGAAQPAS